jgi:Fe-S cluster assembly protein SufD
MIETTMSSLILPKTMMQSQSDSWEVLRQKAEQAISNQVWPDVFQKTWDHSELDSIKGMTPNIESNTITKTDQIPISETAESSLRFVNGCFDASRSNTLNLHPGVQMLSLASNPSLANKLGSQVNPVDSDLLTNLNTARFLDGLVLIVSEGTQVEVPLRVSFINNRTDSQKVTISLPRLLIWLKSRSSVTLVEDYQGYGRYLTSSVTEVIVDDNARLNHERIQRESLEALHFSQSAIRVERSGYYHCRTISLGGRLSSSVQNLTMVEQGADVTLDGLTILGGNQNSSTQSIVNHSASNCTSKQTYRIIADQSSFAAFDGTIHVHKNTQGTNAQQQCRGLLLDAKAQINVRPQLKIYTDDVKCNHEAAIGQLDPDMLFYLRSRGISATLARNVLTQAFAYHLLTNISIPSLKKQLYQLIITLTGTNPLEKLK